MSPKEEVWLMHAERDTYNGYIPEVAGDCVMILMVLCKEITAGDLKMRGVWGGNHIENVKFRTSSY